MEDGVARPRQKWSLDWVLGLFPALVIHLLLAWAVRVFDFIVLPTLWGRLEQVVSYAAVFHLLLVMMLWSYWRCTLADAEEIPHQFKLSDREFCQIVEGRMPQSVAKRDLPVISRGRGNKVPVCAQCKVVKPDRCHHCSVCKRCVLKMDHHCPWVNNCVGHHNYKFFCLFVFYTSLFLATLIGMMSPFIWAWLKGKDKSIDTEIPLCGFVAGVMLFAVLPLKCMHCTFLLDNATTLEHMRSQKFSVDLLHAWRQPTWFDNVSIVCGPRMLLWPFPVRSNRTDGVHWDVILETGELTNNNGGLDGYGDSDDDGLASTATDVDFNASADLVIDDDVEDVTARLLP